MGTFNRDNNKCSVSFLYMADKALLKPHLPVCKYYSSIHHLFPQIYLSLCLPHPSKCLHFLFILFPQNQTADISVHFLSRPHYLSSSRWWRKKKKNKTLKPHAGNHRKPHTTYTHTHTHTDKPRKCLLTGRVTVKCHSLYICLWWA